MQLPGSLIEINDTPVWNFFVCIALKYCHFHKLSWLPCNWLQIEALYDFNQVGIDVVQFHCGPEGCMPYSIKCFLQIHKNMEEVHLVLQVPLMIFSA